MGIRQCECCDHALLAPAGVRSEDGPRVNNYSEPTEHPIPVARGGAMLWFRAEARRRGPNIYYQ